MCDRINFEVSKVKDIFRKEDHIWTRVRAFYNKNAIHVQEIGEIRQKQEDLHVEMDQVKVQQNLSKIYESKNPLLVQQKLIG